MTTEVGALLDGYLLTLERELRDLAPADRAEILVEVRDHFEEARRELSDPTEADLRNILERLGSPSDIAAEARRRLGTTHPTPEPTAAAVRTAWSPGLLEVAALVAWVLWWPLGALLAGLSPRWGRRDKAIAILIELVFWGLVVGYFTTSSYPLPAAAVLFLLLLPPSVHGIFSAAYLGWKLASPGPRTWAAGWVVAFKVGLVVLGTWLAWFLVIGPALVILSHR